MAKILYAEDRGDLREATESMLGIRGHEVTAVADGTQAIEALQNGGLFDVLLTDGDMPPGAHGLEVIEAAQKLEQPPKVIVLYTAANVDRVLPGVIVLDKVRDSAKDVFRKIHDALGLPYHPADQKK